MGILHSAKTCSPVRKVGVLIIVGGPQYRVGAHRQFVRMARALAVEGFPVFRFDYRGMGDSSGSCGGFEHVAPDIRVACDAFLSESRGLEGVVVFGLCDAASAALMYVQSDPRVQGIILANPWVRTDAGEARSFVRHYYWRRLSQLSFWRKLLSGQLKVGSSLADFVRKWVRAATFFESRVIAAVPYLDRMLRGLRDFPGPILLLISERDLTAQEFCELCRVSTKWKSAVERPGVTTVNCSGADHTFSSQQAHDKLMLTIVGWLTGRDW